MARSDCEYSEKVPGTEGNYKWAVRFDDTRDGFLGITQYDEDDRCKDRVLLGRTQVEGLIRFYRKWHAAPKAAKR